jgi:cell division protein FtsW (lipid II flippase)
MNENVNYDKKTKLKTSKEYLWLSIGVILFGIVLFIYELNTEKDWFVCTIAIILGVLSLITSIKRIEKYK